MRGMQIQACECGHVFRAGEDPPDLECHDCTHRRAERAESERDALGPRAEAAEAQLARALREVRAIRESLEGSADPYEGDPYDRGAYALAEEIEAILTGRSDDIEPEQGEEAP